MGGDHSPKSVGDDDRPTCRLCGIVLRDADAVVVAGDAPVHAPCTEASHGDRSVWEHTDVVTLSEWSRSNQWGGSAST